ncbi:MAG: ParB/RepB/Spo0J family partition protein, partial [Nitrospira sp.]|nr:ParB/RepB/Spo0J family partition protein [Nitrospira sp.]
MASDHKSTTSDRDRSKPVGASQQPQGSKESRRLQDLVNRRVDATFQDDGGQNDLGEFLATPSPQAKQPPVTKVIPMTVSEASPAPQPSPQLATSAVGADNIQDILIDHILPSPYQPRQQLNEAADLELADSVKESGLLQPVIVRALPDGRYELVAGERRWRACRQAGKTSIQAIVRPTNDQQAAVNALVENLQREDLSPLDLARAFDRMLKTFKLEHQELSTLLGVTVSKIRHAVRVLALPTEILEEVLGASSGLGLHHAEELLAIRDNPVRLKVIVKKLLEEKWSVERLRGEIQRK